MSAWYGASLVFEATHELESVPTALWEERIVLIQADDQTEARARAEQIGLDGEHEYSVDSPEPLLLRWRFRGIESVYEMLEEAPGDGIEVFSRFLGVDQAAVLLTRMDS